MERSVNVRAACLVHPRGAAVQQRSTIIMQSDTVAPHTHVLTLDAGAESDYPQSSVCITGTGIYYFQISQNVRLRVFENEIQYHAQETLM